MCTYLQDSFGIFGSYLRNNQLVFELFIFVPVAQKENKHGSFLMRVADDH